MNGGAFIDAARGAFIIGDLALPVADAEPAGALRLFPPAGPVLRPITFGERFRLVERSALAADPVENLCAAIMRCATVSPGEMELSDDERNACQTLALLLAGAGIDAPPFAESMLLVGGSAGWHYREIEEAEASRIDYLARRLEPKHPDPDDGWSRVVFEEEQEQGADAIRRDLATRLLSRFADPDAGEADGAMEVFGGTAVSGGPAGEGSWKGMDAGPQPAGSSGAGFGEVEGDGRFVEPGARAMKGGGSESPIQAASAPGAAMGPAEAESSDLPARRRAKVLGYSLKGWEKRSEAQRAPASETPASATGATGQGGFGPWEEPAAVRDAGGATPAFAAAHERARDFSSRFPAEMPLPSARETMSASGLPAVPGSAAIRRSVASPFGSSSAPAPRAMPTHDPVPPSQANGTGPAVPAPRSWSFTEEPNEAAATSGTAAMILGAPYRPEEDVVPSIIMELADALAELLHEEADLRGIDR